MADVNKTSVHITSSFFLLDLDECLSMGDTCEGVCINTIGSYHCQCTLGYETVNNNGTIACEGIDNRAISIS